MPVPLLPLVLAGGGAMLLLAGNKKAGQTASQTEGATGIAGGVATPTKAGDASIDSLTKVIASADPATLLKASADMAAAGYKNTAAELAKMAEKAASGNMAPIPIPPAGDDARTKEVTALAVLLAEHLRNTRKGSEDRKMVAAFQAADKTLKVDGLYGPKTAMALTKYGVFPPPGPFYWPKANTTAAQKEYQDYLKGIMPRVSVNS